MAVLPVFLLQHDIHSQTSLFDSCQLPKPGVANPLRHRSDATSENTQQSKSSFRKGGTRQTLVSPAG
jgi:hypothetical protein